MTKKEKHKLDDYHFKSSEIIKNSWVTFYFKLEHINFRKKKFSKDRSPSSSERTLTLANQEIGYRSEFLLRSVDSISFLPDLPFYPTLISLSFFLSGTNVLTRWNKTLTQFNAFCSSFFFFPNKVIAMYITSEY